MTVFILLSFMLSKKVNTFLYMLTIYCEFHMLLVQSLNNYRMNHSCQTSRFHVLQMYAVVITRSHWYRQCSLEQTVLILGQYELSKQISHVCICAFIPLIYSSMYMNQIYVCVWCHVWWCVLM